MQNILQNTMVQLGGLYAVSQACLLSFFVPQKCPGYIGCVEFGDKNGDGRVPANCMWSPWFKYTSNTLDGHLCAPKGAWQRLPRASQSRLTRPSLLFRAAENLDWYNFSPLNKQVFLMNCITLAVMLLAQSYFWKREVWMINHLSEDNTVPYSNLPSEIGEYPEFDDAVRGYNKGAFYFALAVGCCIVINFGLSTDFLINGDGVYNYNLGSRTITGLLTVRFAARYACLLGFHLTRTRAPQNTMLVSTKVLGYLSYARLSYANEWAISMFSVVPVSYNVVDEMCKERKARQLDPIEVMSPA